MPPNTLDHRNRPWWVGAPMLMWAASLLFSSSFAELAGSEPLKALATVTPVFSSQPQQQATLLSVSVWLVGNRN